MQNTPTTDQTRQQKINQACKDLLSALSMAPRADADAVLDYLHQRISERNLVQVGMPVELPGMPQVEG